MSAQQYVDNEALNVDPVELICLLYSKAIEKLNQATTSFEAEEFDKANGAVAFAMEIVVELQGALSEKEATLPPILRISMATSNSDWPTH
jgi:flagellin-specific chaperone FliS